MTADGLMHLQEIAAEIAVDREEATLMLGALRALAHAPTPIEPPETLRERLMAHLRFAERGAVFTEHGFLFASGAAVPWINLAPGIRVKVFHDDRAHASRTALVEMAPFLTFPAHDHEGIEDLYLIAGDAWVGDVPMRAGDYCRAPSGSVHNDVRSGASGAVAIVVQR